MNALVRLLRSVLGSRVLLVTRVGLMFEGTGAVHAQPTPRPRAGVWQADGSVHALAVDGDVAYLGGSFSYLGPASGSLGIVRRLDAVSEGAFPNLDGSVLATTPDGSWLAVTSARSAGHRLVSYAAGFGRKADRVAVGVPGAVRLRGKAGGRQSRGMPVPGRSSP